MISLIRHDSLKKQFEYAERTKGADRLISIALEPQVSSPRDWWGGVGMVLGSRSCTDLSAALGAPAAESEHLLEPQLRALVDEVTNLRGGGATASGGAVPGGAVPGGAGGAQGGVLLGGAHVDASAGTAGFSGAVLGASAVLGGELPHDDGLAALNACTCDGRRVGGRDDVRGRPLLLRLLLLRRPRRRGGGASAPAAQAPS